MATIRCEITLGDDRINRCQATSMDELLTKLKADHTMSDFEHNYFKSKGAERLAEEIASGWYIKDIEG